MWMLERIAFVLFYSVMALVAATCMQELVGRMDWKFLDMHTNAIAAVGTCIAGFGAVISACVAAFAVKSQAAAATRQLEAAARSALRQTVASVVTSGRLQWIDAFRDDMAQFLSLMDTAHMPGKDNDLQRARLFRHRIELRLDPKKEEHGLLLANLDRLLRQAMPGDDDIGVVRDQAKALIEREWKRARDEVAGVELLSSPSQTGSLTT